MFTIVYIFWRIWMKLFKKSLIILFLLLILLLCIGSIHAQDLNSTNNDTFEVEEVSVKTYSDLYYKINSTDTDSILDLNESYRFDPVFDNESFIDGVPISKNLTLVGKNNTFIDGNFLASGLNISSDCSVVLRNINFINGYSETSGGAILAGKNSNLLIDNCTFHNNKVHNSNGGAVYGLDGTNIEIHNSEFDSNVAERKTNLSWNAFKCGMGSAICMRIGSNLKLHNSTFKNNNGYVTTILIITWDDVNTNQSTLYVDNCLFDNNTAWSNGAIYLDEFGIAEIKNSIFKRNNSTKLGGTIVFDASINAIVKNCTFENNTGINGGGIYINTFNTTYSSYVEIYDSNFTSNNAVNYGGGIYSKYSETKISNCKFNDNYASVDGGGVYFNVGSLDIQNSEFFGNSANNGGGLLVKANEGFVDNSLFVKNVALNKGGGVYAGRDSIRVSNSKFNENTAEYGGGLLLKNNESFVDKSSFNKNIASLGGAVYSNGVLTKISNSDFCENSAEYGGALSMKSNENFIEKSSFKKNFASVSGGAINSNVGLIKISDSSFTENSAKYGGGLLLKANENAVVKSTFTKNTASKSGGAIYSTMEMIYSSGCSFYKNSAPKASKVYGVFYAEITKYVDVSGKVKLKITISSLWKMSVAQKIKLKFNGYTSKWLKTDSKGKLVFTVPKNKYVNKKLSITMDEGICVVKSFNYKIPGKIKIPKTVKKYSKLKITIKNSKTKKPIKRMHFTVKISNGKKYKKLIVKTNSKGVLKVKISKFSRGKHKISIYLNNDEYYIHNKYTFKIK